MVSWVTKLEGVGRAAEGGFEDVESEGAPFSDIDATDDVAAMLSFGVFVKPSLAI